MAILQFRNEDFADRHLLFAALLVAPERAVDRFPARAGHWRYTPADQFLVLVRQLGENPLSHGLSRNAVRHLAVRRISLGQTEQDGVLLVATPLWPRRW